VDLPAALPLFPLPDHVLLPGMPVPLRVFEPRYQALVADLAALPEDRRWLAVPRLAEGWQSDYEGRPPFLPVAAAARVRQIRALDDGHSLIVVEGIARCRLSEIPSALPYRMARCVALPDESYDHDAAAYAEAVNAVVGRVRHLARRVGEGGDQLATWMGGAAVEDGLVDRLAAALISDPDLRQRYLECRDPSLRVALFSKLVASLPSGGPPAGWDFSRN
jgi:Lon protease-like protein